MDGRLARIVVLSMGTFAFGCATAGPGDAPPFASGGAVPDGGSLEGDSATGSDSGSSSPPADNSGDDATAADDATVASDDAGDDSSSSSSSDDGGCNAPTCAACVTGMQCCTTAGACGCTLLTLCL
jgi:hypothetical protein